MNKKYKSVKLFCLRKGNLFIAWDGKSLTEKPHEGIRVSRIIGKRKYKDFEMLSFPEAYDQWYRARQAQKGTVL